MRCQEYIWKILITTDHNVAFSAFLLGERNQ
jgi:hypothetical protein